jgi:V/A-type H+-transporting ATPase subunit I
MSRISVVGLHSDRKAVLETLHQKEIVEVGELDAQEVRFEGALKSIAQFDRHMLAAESALVILNEHTPEKSGFFTNRRVLPMPKYHMTSGESDEVLKSIDHIIGLSDKLRGCAENIRQITAKQIALEPYLALDVPMSTRETAYTSIKIGTLNGLWQTDRLQKEMAANNLASVHFEIINTSKEYTYVWFAFLKIHEHMVGTFLQNIGFAEPTFIPTHYNPAKENGSLEDAKIALKIEAQRNVSEIKCLNNCRRDIEHYYDYLSLRKDKYQVLAKTGTTEYVFFLQG